MEAGIITHLLAGTAIAVVVGTRVYPVDRPQGSAFPALTVTRISGGPLYADDGEVGLDNGRVQVDCWALTYTAAKDLASLVRARLSAVRDVSGFRYIMLDSERDIREGGGNVAEYPFHVSQDYNVWKDS
jgi:hypothetical protein